MVARATNKRTTVILAFSLVMAAVVGAVAMAILGRGEENTNIEAEGSALDSSDEIAEMLVTALPAAVDLQPTVDAWANNTSGNKSILIYDLDRDEVAASYNTGEEYIMESLYKLFVVYEGYKRIENGTWDAEMIVNSAGQSLIECLDLAIRESNSACAEPIWSLIGASELEQIAHSEWGISDATSISHIVSNVEDIYKIMRRFYEHPDFNNETLVSQMLDSFLNQPPSYGLCTGPCNWRQGLPSGFSGNVDVYNKVGWRWGESTWATYHDAAIVHFKKSGRTFIMVVMTNYISYQDIASLATQIEQNSGL